MKTILVLIFLSLGAYAEQDSEGFQFHRYIERLLEQAHKREELRVKLIEIMYEYERVYNDRIELGCDGVMEKYNEFTEKYNEVLVAQLPEHKGIKEKWNTYQDSYSEGDHEFLEKLIEKFPRIKELKVKLIKTKEEYDRAELGCNEVMEKYNEVLEVQLPEHKGIKEKWDKYIEVSETYDEVMEDHYKAKEELAKESPEVEQLWNKYVKVEEESDRVEEEYDEALDELVEEIPEVVKLLIDEFYMEEEERAEKNIDEILEELAEKAPEVKQLRDKFYKAEEERTRAWREYFETKNKLVEKPPELRRLLSEGTKAHGEYKDEVTKAYSYRPLNYSELLDELVEQNPEVERLRAILDQAIVKLVEAHIEYQTTEMEYNGAKGELIDELVEQSKII